MITNKCNAHCPHCIVDAKSEGSDLSQETISSVLQSVPESEIDTILIYGGEPFLHAGKNGLLWRVLPEALESGAQNVHIASNGFWGKYKETRREILGRINEIAVRYDKAIHIDMSIDQYHQQRIPVTALSNIVIEHSTKAYENVRLMFQAFADPTSNSVVDKLFDDCWKAGVCLVEANNGTYLYPADKEELIDVEDINRTPKQRELLRETFGCSPVDFPYNVSSGHLHAMLDSGHFIARTFDAGEGKKNYFIVPKANRIIDFLVEKEIINAGRGKVLNGRKSEHQFKASYAEEESHVLIIAPDGNAYKWPAQIAEQIKPVSCRGKSIAALTQEIRRVNL